MGSRKRKFSPGQEVKFRKGGELKVGILSSIKEYRDTDRREFFVEVLCPPNKYTIPLNKVYKSPGECEEHGEKLFSTERDEYICPFCNDR